MIAPAAVVDRGGPRLLRGDGYLAIGQDPTSCDAEPANTGARRLAWVTPYRHFQRRPELSVLQPPRPAARRARRRAERRRPAGAAQGFHDCPGRRRRSRRPAPAARNGDL